MNPVRRLHLLTLVEGVSTLVLFFVAMPLKYFAGKPEAVKIVGWLHGILFVAVMVATVCFGLRAAHTLGFSAVFGYTDDRRYDNVFGERGFQFSDVSQFSTNLDWYLQERLYLTETFALVLGGQVSYARRENDEHGYADRGMDGVPVGAFGARQVAHPQTQAKCPDDEDCHDPVQGNRRPAPAILGVPDHGFLRGLTPVSATRRLTTA